MLVTTSSNKYLLNRQAGTLVSSSRRREKQWPTSPGDYSSPWRRGNCQGDHRCGSCPGLRGWQGDSGPHPHSTASGWLCGNVEVAQEGSPHPALCSLGCACVPACVCVCVCVYVCTGEGPGRQGPGQPRIFLKEYIHAAVEDSDRRVASSSGDLPDSCEDQILFQKEGGERARSRRDPRRVGKRTQTRE